MSVLTDIENCQESILGTYFDGCAIEPKEIKKIFLLSPLAVLSATDALDATTISTLIKKKYLIPINEILQVAEAGAKNNVQTLPNKVKLFVSQGLYEFMPDIIVNICYVKALHRLKKKKWEILLVDADGRLYFDRKGTAFKGFATNLFMVENEAVSDGGSKTATVTLDIQLSQSGTRGYNERRSFKLDPTNEDYFNDITGIEDVVLSSVTLGHTAFKVKVLAGCDKSTPILGLDTENFKVVKSSDGTTVSATVTEVGDGIYSIDGASAGDVTVQLYDSVLNLPVADILETRHYQSNVLAITLT